MKSFLIVFIAFGVTSVNPGYVRASRKHCPPSYFACGNSSQCVKQVLQCNKQLNCLNGADEENCVDEAGAIKDLWKKLQENLNKSKITNATDCRLDEYPKQCSCQFRTTINCAGSNFTRIPENIDRNVTVLIFKRNRISQPTAEQFEPYKRLSVIFLDKNDIEYIPEGLFSNLRRLATLSLAKNNIRSVKKNTFNGLKYCLQHLFLQENNLNNFDPEFLSDIENIESLQLQSNGITLDGVNFPPLRKLKLLHLDHNKIKEINKDTLSALVSLSGLFLDHNLIEYIHPEAFHKLIRLAEVDLGHNRLTSLPSSIFKGLSRLSLLALDSNPIKRFPRSIFRPLKAMKSLYLRNVEITDIDLKLFEPMQLLDRIYFKKFRYCSYVPHVRICEPRSDGLSSTEHLLVKPVLRVCVWIVATITCIGNSIVLLGRMLSSSSEEASTISLLFIKNLSAADLLMGIYLFVVASMDMNFRDNYNLNAHAWMSSLSCTVCGVLAMTSSEVSVLTLSIMSIERHSRIVNPLSSFQLSAKKAYLILTFVWLCGLAVAILPAVYWSYASPIFTFYGTNGLCFPLHMEDPFKIGWQYSAFVFLGINFISVLIISYAYISMYINILNTRSNTHRKKVEMELAKRFFFIVLTDCLCWIPIIVLKIVALTETKIPEDIYAWVVVFVLPVNSAMNPVIYSISSKVFWKRLKELLKRKLSLPKWSENRARTFTYQKADRCAESMSMNHGESVLNHNCFDGIIIEESRGFVS
ncbi:RXFP1 (predicted) [Pycnogonum litorale]